MTIHLRSGKAGQDNFKVIAARAAKQQHPQL
jgi:hypothetical protein